MPVSPRQRARILVVDDDCLLLGNLGAWLSMHGYDPVMAADAAMALAALEQQSIDVGIIDLHLPDVHGLELLSLLKERDPHLRLIVLTGHVTVDNAIAALRKGLAYDFLRKPLSDLIPLQEAIESALAARERGPLALPSAAEAAGLVATLSAREREVLSLLTEGLQNKEIASRIFVSEKTVRNQLSSIYRKLGVTSRMQALVICRDAGLIA